MLNHSGSILNSNEGHSACKQLIVNVIYQSHSILQSQGKADLHS